MSISESDIKFRKSVRQTDTDTNGGRKGSANVVSGARHNLFPRVTKAERTSGVTRYRKQFWCNENADDLPAYGALVFPEFPSTGGDFFAIAKGNQSDEQSDIDASYSFGGIGQLNTSLSGGETAIVLDMPDDELEFPNGGKLHIADKVQTSQTVNSLVRIGDMVTIAAGTWSKSSATDIVYPNGVYLGDNAVLSAKDTTNEEWLTIAIDQHTATIGTGDGADTSPELDDLTITRPVVGKGTFAAVVTAICGGVTKTVNIAADGTCSGDCSAGELNLSTGAWITDITWTVAPDNATDIEITYSEQSYSYSGNTATVYLDDTVANAYATENTYAGVCVEGDEIAAACDTPVVTTAGTMDFDHTTYPIIAHNDGAEHDTITIQFTNATAFSCSGTNLGSLGTGNISSDFSPTNPNTGQPVFTLDADGWSGTPEAGDTVVFDLEPSAMPIWMKEVVPAATSAASVNLLVMGWYTE